MIKHPNRLWITVLLLGWCFDFLFWGKSIGINFAIFISLCLVGGFCVLLLNGQKPALNSLWLILPLVFFVVITFLRREPLTLFLAFAFTLVPMGIFSATYLGGHWPEYSLTDYVYKIMQLFDSVITRPGVFFVQIRQEQAGGSDKKIRFPVLSVLRGLLLALPVVLCFASLLASADLVFGKMLNNMLAHFDIDGIVEYIIRLVLILFWGYGIAGVILYASAKSQDVKLPGAERNLFNPVLGFTESAIVLGSVNILFLSFVIIQFRYFFGGNANIGIEGMTYSQYARQGFNELVAVALISLLLILGLTALTMRGDTTKRRIYSGLNIAIVLLVLVILASAYQRLTLAIDWHGFSRLRLYPQIFLVWVGILLATVVVLEALQRERFFAFAALLASLGFAVSLSLFNIDSSIVHHNVLRAAQGKHFNASYLATLSTDAVPALVEEFSDLSLSWSIHEGIGAALLCHLHSDAMTASSKNTDWRSFNFSIWKARKALGTVQGQLDGYRVNVKKVPMRVRTPNNVLYLCVDKEPENPSTP